ncbi:F-box only protein 50-like [Odontesthes bonariensis]|uniref:F-box only protein 50-like n=1 Tax=Odontesthes bonariensis TaxID=219752 RepID=UPI003F58C92E
MYCYNEHSPAECRKRCETEWGLQGAPMPDSVDWKSVCEAKPLGRNLLKNPLLHLLSSKDTPPPKPNLTFGPPPSCQPDGERPSSFLGDFTGWTTSIEVLPYDSSGIPAGAGICAILQFRLVSLEIKHLHESIYQLHVKLLGTDKSTVISEHTVNPSEELSTYSHKWKEVSHVFSGYGPGVNFFFFTTQFTGSS